MITLDSWMGTGVSLHYFCIFSEKHAILALNISMEQHGHCCRSFLPTFSVPLKEFLLSLFSEAEGKLVFEVIAYRHNKQEL